jgi:threonine aldolase
MRFLAAQFDALLQDELWRRCASHANAMAARLAERVRDLPGLRITRPVETNAVFAALAPAVTSALQLEFPFYTWDETAGEVRWMCSWDTSEEDVDTFAAAVRDSLAGSAV